MAMDISAKMDYIGYRLAVFANGWKYLNGFFLGEHNATWSSTAKQLKRQVQ